LDSLLNSFFIPYNSPVVYKTFETTLNQLSPQFFHCNVCNIPVSGKTNLYAHNEGRQHLLTLEALMKSDALDLVISDGDDEEEDGKILLGLEYIVELVKSGKSKVIVCELCSKNFNLSADIIHHFKGDHTHNEKYLVSLFTFLYH
jgi:hypothetical protein